MSFFGSRRLWELLDGTSLLEYPIDTSVPQDSILCTLLSLLYINDLPDNLICNVAVYAGGTAVYFRCNRASDFVEKGRDGL